MSSKKNRGSLSRLGKSAEEIFRPLVVDDAPVPEAEPVSSDSDASSLLETAPVLAWGLWWRDICQLRTQQICRFWWSDPG